VLAGLVLLARCAGACHDLLHDGGLGVCVVLYVPPGTPGQVALDLQVGVAVRVVGAQPVAEQQHPVDFGRADGEHVQVDGGVRAGEQPVLEPVRLGDDYSDEWAEL
jgi:hypothetical protein